MSAMATPMCDERKPVLVKTNIAKFVSSTLVRLGPDIAKRGGIVLNVEQIMNRDDNASNEQNSVQLS